MIPVPVETHPGARRKPRASGDDPATKGLKAAGVT